MKCYQARSSQSSSAASFAQPIGPAHAPVVQSGHSDPSIIDLRLADGTGISVRAPGTVLGRDLNGLSDFQFSPYVSSRHADLTYQDGGWYVSLCPSTTNPSELRTGDARIKLSPSRIERLHQGDLLVLADMSFRVTFRDPEVEPRQAADARADAHAGSGASTHEGTEPTASTSGEAADGALVEGWYVQCPQCKRWYLIKDAASKPRRCERCGDSRIFFASPSRDVRLLKEVVDVR